jgi:hypothetical protein
MSVFAASFRAGSVIFSRMAFAESCSCFEKSTRAWNKASSVRMSALLSLTKASNLPNHCFSCSPTSVALSSNVMRLSIILSTILAYPLTSAFSDADNTAPISLPFGPVSDLGLKQNKNIRVRNTRP